VPRPTQDTRPAQAISNTRLSLSMVRLPNLFFYRSPLDASPTTPDISLSLVWPILLSLAATSRISIDFFSCRYLDVSVPYVRFSVTSFSSLDLLYFYSKGFPIRKSPVQSSLNSSPMLIAV